MKLVIDNGTLVGDGDLDLEACCPFIPGTALTILVLTSEKR
jgi:hypothetical protein